MNNFKKKKKVLIMTACISPYEGVPILKLTNTRERLSHYENALEKYIVNSDFQSIILVDNSNYNLDITKYKILSKKYKKDFEYLSFVGNKEKAISKGKSYGEGEIIEYAILNSKILINNEYFFKVSGRYYIINNQRILKKIDMEYNYFAPWDYRLKKKKGIDTVFFGCKISDYNKFLYGEHEKANEAKCITYECILYECLKKSSIKYRYFPYSPKYDVPIQASTGFIPKYNIIKEIYKYIILKMYNLILLIKDNI